MLSKRRQLVLTDAPRLFYIDPQSLAVMGEIPWSKDLKPQYRSTKLFFVHTVRLSSSPVLLIPRVSLHSQRRIDHASHFDFSRLQPDRTYYLEDASKQAITWVDVIQQVQREYGATL
jgi:3-phosphoinositide dependent protein kinase-1